MKSFVAIVVAIWFCAASAFAPATKLASGVPSQTKITMNAAERTYIMVCMFVSPSSCVRAPYIHTSNPHLSIFSRRSSLMVFRYVLSAVRRDKIPTGLLNILGEKSK